MKQCDCNEYLSLSYKAWFLEFRKYPTFAQFFFSERTCGKKLISFTKNMKLKVLDKSFCEGFPNSAVDTIQEYMYFCFRNANVMLHCNFGQCLAIHRAGPPRELMAKEKLTCGE